MKASLPEFDVVTDEMAALLGRKSGAERLEIANRMFVSARRMLIHHLRAEHPEWTVREIEKEVARRLSHGAV